MKNNYWKKTFLYIYKNKNNSMIQIDSVEIKNFKSIVDYKFDFTPINIENSKCGIFVGLNESGKSAFLEAMSLINNGLDIDKYENQINTTAHENEELLELYVNYNVLNSATLLKNTLLNKFLDESIVDKINIIGIKKNLYINTDNEAEEIVTYNFKDLNINFKDYFLTTVNEVVNNITYKRKAIQKRIFDIEEDIKEPSLDDLNEILNRLLKLRIKFNIPKVQLWKSSSEFLINDEIDLIEFKENPQISIPLRNIFNVYGKKSKDEINSTIDKALKSPAKRDELVEKISESITKHINKIWKEHKIKIRVSINGNKCNVLVEDKDNKFSYFGMNQRSDGFKQFMSLILSLSTLNESNTLNNNIILIDEPEVHLHPSGIAYMRDELLKIAKNNYVLISTHSQFMIDTNNPERQFIVTKNKGETKIEQVDENTNFKEDSVLKNAFGLNLYKELLPDKIIIVEGGDDRHFFNHCLTLYNFRNFAIKSAGGASKTPTFAGLLSNEELEPYIILDSDKEGKDNKRKIIDTYKQSYTNDNVMTLKEIYNTLPENATIEDLYPIDFLKTNLKMELGKDFGIDNSSSIIIQLKNLDEKLKNDKQKLESLKVKLSNAFVKEFDTIDKLKSCERLSVFLDNLIIKLQ